MGGSWHIPALVLVGAWIALVVGVHVVRRTSTRGPDDLGTGAAILVFRIYSRLVHLVRFEGLEHVPRTKDAGPLLLVANHTAGVDPLLIQAGCRFEIRWMMADDMRLPRFDAFWKFARIIFVDRSNGDAKAAGAAMAHLRRGGVIGVFPEGRIERPPGEIHPFMVGVGVFAKRTGATVLPVFVEGTPYARTAWGSLWKPSRSRVVFLEPVRYKGSKLSAREVAEDLRRRVASVAGWPLNDSPLPPDATTGRYGK